jgi:hypothetical protein
VLFSFVYAAAVTHLLSTAGEIIIASKRIRLGLLHALTARRFREQVRLWNSNA